MPGLELIQRNKALTVFAVLAVVISGFVIRPAPSTPIAYANIVLPDGRSVNTALYPHLTAEQIGIFNYFRDVIMALETEDFTGIPKLFTHYMLAFSVYTMATLFEVTPGYRTDYYRAWQEQMIAKMNSSWIEEFEWNRFGFNDTSLFGEVAGYRGPGNIMWTGHYAMMMALYERFFRNGRYNTELTWYMDQFNHTMTYDKLDNPHVGGYWNCGMIVCEPYIVFVQCNSIPQWTMTMVDSLWGTQYRDAYSYALNWLMENMIDDHGCFIDGYYVTAPPENWTYLPDRFLGIGPARLGGSVNHTNENGYGIAWALMLINSYKPSIPAQMYSEFETSYVRHMYPDMSYALAAYSYPDRFGAMDMLANMYTFPCAKEMGDWPLHRQLANFLFSPWPFRWRGYQGYFDLSALSSLGLEEMLTLPINFDYVWGTTPTTMKDLSVPKPASYFALPYISSTTGRGLFVHQAYYDDAIDAFILTVNAHEQSTITFSNYPGVQGVQSSYGPLSSWTQNDTNMTLTLPPGVWNLVVY